MSEPASHHFMQAMIEVANRAEATALLARCGYRVYRPEADIEGEDLVIRPPAGELLGVQLKSRPTVDWKKYGGRGLLMLFPSGAFTPEKPRLWFLIDHDKLFGWVKIRHRTAPKWAEYWHYPTIGKELYAFLEPFVVRPPLAPEVLANIPDVDPPSDDMT